MSTTDTPAISTRTRRVDSTTSTPAVRIPRSGEHLVVRPEPCVHRLGAQVDEAGGGTGEVQLARLLRV